MPASGLVVPVPIASAAGGGVCRDCHGAARGDRCFCCATLLARLGSLSVVVPVGLCPVPGPWHTMLRSYKDSPAPSVRRRYGEQLGSMLAGFVLLHGRCLEGFSAVPLEVTALVPARVGRPRPWPMAAVAAAAASHGLPSVAPALEWHEGASDTDHLVASPDAFVVAPTRRGALRGRGVVLLDDTYTTGATAQSAARAVRDAGAASVVVLVLARVVRPGASPVQRSLWERARTGATSACAAGARCRWA